MIPQDKFATASAVSQQRTVTLNWQRVPESLPPGKERGYFSPEVWLALSDGNVYKGRCLHKSAGSTYDAPVHSWFCEINGKSTHLACDDFNGAHVIAWMPFASPEHPDVLGYGDIQILREVPA